MFLQDAADEATGTDVETPEAEAPAEATETPTEDTAE